LGQPLIESLVTKQLRLNSNQIPDGHPGANYWYPGDNPPTNYWHPGSNLGTNYGPPGCNLGTNYWPHTNYQPSDQRTNYRPPLAGGNPRTKKRPPGSNSRTKNWRPGGNLPTKNRPVPPPLTPRPTVQNVISDPPLLRIPFKRKDLPTVEKLDLKEGFVYFVCREATVSYDYSSISRNLTLCCRV
jgi:hypothetical protein